MKNRSAALTLWANRLLMLTVVGLAFAMPKLLPWYNRFRPLEEETNLACTSSDGRLLVFNSSLLSTKTSKATHGVGVMTLKKQRTVVSASLLSALELENVPRYRVKSIPAAGAILKREDIGEKQLSLID